MSDHRNRLPPHPESPARLQRRLEEGWDLIEAAKVRGEPTAALERHWIRLLGELERLSLEEVGDV